jgi:hypothetical protein
MAVCEVPGTVSILNIIELNLSKAYKAFQVTN